MYSVERMRRDGACFTPSRQEWEFEKMLDGRGRHPCASIHRTDGCSPRCPTGPARRPRLGSVQRNPVFAPRSHGKMAPWHPMPPHAPCMDPWTRFPFKFEWDLAGRPDTVGPARDFGVLAHGMIIMGQG